MQQQQQKEKQKVTGDEDPKEEDACLTQDEIRQIYPTLKPPLRPHPRSRWLVWWQKEAALHDQLSQLPESEQLGRLKRAVDAEENYDLTAIPIGHSWWTGFGLDDPSPMAVNFFEDNLHRRLFMLWKEDYGGALLLAMEYLSNSHAILHKYNAGLSPSLREWMHFTVQQALVRATADALQGLVLPRKRKRRAPKDRTPFLSVKGHRTLAGQLPLDGVDMMISRHAMASSGGTQANALAAMFPWSGTPDEDPFVGRAQSVKAGEGLFQLGSDLQSVALLVAQCIKTALQQKQLDGRAHHVLSVSRPVYDPTNGYLYFAWQCDFYPSSQ